MNAPTVSHLQAVLDEMLKLAEQAGESFIDDQAGKYHCRVGGYPPRPTDRPRRADHAPVAAVVRGAER